MMIRSGSPSKWSPVRATGPGTPPGSRGRSTRGLALLLASGLLATACAGSGTEAGPDEAASTSQESGTASSDAGDGAETTIEVTVDGTADSTADSTAGASSVSLSERIVELPPAEEGFPEAEDAPAPVGMRIPALGIDTAAPVVGVGIETNGDMEVPPADEVGWYQFGPSPGQTGSSVLAAHIAFDGVDGVFVNLHELPEGSLISVDYDDGTTADFIAVSKEQYNKAELPRDQIFGRDGDPSLVLITCGGDFNRSVRSYDDNVVIYAEPVGERY